jgi:hypothetical protein
LPNHITADEIKAFFTEHALPDEAMAEIVKVNMAYDIDDYIALQKKYIFWQTRLQSATEQGSCMRASRRKCEGKVEALTTKIAAMEETILAQTNFARKAFITFRNERDAKASLRYLSHPLLQDWWKKFMHILCFFNSKTRIKMDGKRFVVERAPEPTDVLWENLGNRGACKRRTVTILITILLLAV